MHVAEHLVAHARFGERCLLEPQRASFLWASLKQQLPDALAASLMPNHVHVGAPPGARARFERALRRFGRRFGVHFDVPEPQVASSHEIAGRMFRYVVLNPVRARLTNSLLAAPYATARDWLGATVDPWVSDTRLAAFLRLPTNIALATVTRLDDGRVEYPHRMPPAAATVQAAIRAAAAAMAIPVDQVAQCRKARRLVTQALAAIGPHRADELALALGCTARTVFRNRAAPEEPGLRAVLLCLSDPRLRTTVEDLALNARLPRAG